MTIGPPYDAIEAHNAKIELANQLPFVETLSAEEQDMFLRYGWNPNRDLTGIVRHERGYTIRIRSDVTSGTWAWDIVTDDTINASGNERVLSIASMKANEAVSTLPTMKS